MSTSRSSYRLTYQPGRKALLALGEFLNSFRCLVEIDEKLLALCIDGILIAHALVELVLRLCPLFQVEKSHQEHL